MQITKPNYKKMIKGIISILILTVVPLLIGFLCSYFLDRKNLFETIAALFAIVYLFIFLIRLGRKDNIYYRKNKYKSKDEFKSSDLYKKYIFIQIILTICICILVVSSLFIFFFYK